MKILDRIRKVAVIWLSGLKGPSSLSSTDAGKVVIKFKLGVMAVSVLFLLLDFET